MVSSSYYQTTEERTWIVEEVIKKEAICKANGEKLLGSSVITIHQDGEWKNPWHIL